jgi:ribonuclease E
VIDFIDMESRRNIAAVEKRLKDALKIDRARIQVGSISHFGLMEMSRQRLRPSLAETSLVMCTHCAGTGQVRSTESAALHVLRAVEEEGAKRRAAEVVVHVAGSIALYVLNRKRVRLAEIETRYGMRVAFAADDTLLPPNTRIERVRAQAVSELPAPISQLAPPEPFEDPDEEPIDQSADQSANQPADGAANVAAAGDDGDDDDAPRPGETAEEGEQRSRRRRRRRRGGRREDGVIESAALANAAEAQSETAESGVAEPAITELEGAPAPSGDTVPEVSEAVMEALTAEATQDDAPAAADGAISETADASGDDADRSKRRGRRGGRRRRREPGDVTAEPADSTPGEPTDAPAYAAPAQTPPAYTPPAYAGPTPADPFGGSSAFDIFDAIEQAEQERALAATAPGRRTPEPTTTELPTAEPQPEPQPEPPLQATRREPEPVIAEPVALQPETVSLADPEPVEPKAEPTSEPVAGPLIVPTLIDGADTLTEKKRGWWRR